MPLLLSKQISDNAAYAVWNIQETFLELPYLSPEPYPPNLHPVRQAEWIVGRILIKRLCDIFQIDYQGVESLETGKPVLKNSEAEISISHSFPIASAMLKLDGPCGIDMEQPRQKMLDVQGKFMNETEESYRNDLGKVCTIWCAKEVVYKIHGRKYLSLKNEIDVQIEDESRIKAQITRPEELKDFNLAYDEHIRQLHISINKNGDDEKGNKKVKKIKKLVKK